MRQDEINHRWQDISRGIRTLWGSVEMDELLSMQGDLRQVEDTVEERTHESREAIRHKLGSLLSSFEHETEAESSYGRRPESTAVPIMSRGQFGDTEVPASDGQDHNLGSFGSHHPLKESNDLAEHGSAHRPSSGRDRNSDLSDVNLS
jgi:hypothetical protein